MKYFSMFSGIGGFDLALNNCGHECIGYSEINKYAVQVYKKNFGNEVINYGDATKIVSEQLPDFDLFCGGFPCQAFSIAGKRKGFDDTRGTLFFEIARILKTKRPKNFILENVKGLLNHDKGKTFGIIIQALDELGYDVQWMVFNSKFFGVPQNRERVFIIGSLRGTSRPEILPFKEINREVINESSEKKWKFWDDYNKKIRDVCPTLTQPEHNSIRLLKGLGGGQGAKTGLYMIDNPLKDKTNFGWHFEQNVYSKESNIRSLKSTEGSGNKPKVINDMMIRRLTPKECERLQGFPDGWTEGLSDTQRYKCLGNAVTVNVVQAITELNFNG